MSLIRGNGMDKCVREKESLYNFKLENADKLQCQFYEKDSNVDSYFEMYEEEDYLLEYNFETLPQLREMLIKLWKNEEDMKGELKPILAAAMKNKPSRDEGLAIKRAEDGMQTFIYNF